MFGDQDTHDPYVYLLAAGIVFVTIGLISIVLGTNAAQWSWTSIPIGAALILFWWSKRPERSEAND